MIADSAFHGQRIITSSEALEFDEVPEHLIVIGGGFIGLEMGSVFGRLRARVTVIEFLDSIVPNLDQQLGKALQRALKPLNFTFRLNTGVTATEVNGETVTVTAETRKGETVSFEGDYVLVSVGRRPYTEDLGLHTVGVQTDKRGCIEIDTGWRTATENVYAIGDVVAGPMLAHKAEEEGVTVVELIDGQNPELNTDLIPGVVYTWPEVASVGKSEEQLKAAGIEYSAGSFPFKASGRARAAEETEGFIKVLADKSSDEILGVHMIGPRFSDMIAEAVVAMEFRASAEDIGRIIHAHPTFTESFKEAALMATADRALHI